MALLDHNTPKKPASRLGRWLRGPLVSRILTPRLRRQRIRATLDAISRLRQPRQFDEYAQTIHALFAPERTWNDRALPSYVPAPVRRAFHEGLARAEHVHAKKIPGAINSLKRAIDLFQILGLREAERAAWNDYPRSLGCQSGIHRIWWISGGFALLDSTLLPRAEAERMRESLAAAHHAAVDDPRFMTFRDASTRFFYALDDARMQDRVRHSGRTNAALVRTLLIARSPELGAEERKDFAEKAAQEVNGMHLPFAQRREWTRSFQGLLRRPPQR